MGLAPKRGLASLAGHMLLADSMKNVNSLTVSGSKEALEVPKNFNDLRKLGTLNIKEIKHASACNVEI